MHAARACSFFGVPVARRIPLAGRLGFLLLIAVVSLPVAEPQGETHDKALLASFGSSLWPKSLHECSVACAGTPTSVFFLNTAHH